MRKQRSLLFAKATSFIVLPFFLFLSYYYYFLVLFFSHNIIVFTLYVKQKKKVFEVYQRELKRQEGNVDCSFITLFYILLKELFENFTGVSILSYSFFFSFSAFTTAKRKTVLN